MSRQLTADEMAAAISKAEDLPIEKLNVPEWNLDVYIRTMTGAERSQWELSIVDGEKGGRDNIYARLAYEVICDHTGKRVFTSPQQAMGLGGKSCKALKRVFEKAQKLNGLSEEDVKELAKNSGGGPESDSGSDSPATLDSQ